MQKRFLKLCVVFLILGLGSASASESSLVIVFKDGHQQTFSMSDVSRIEFKSTENAAFVGRGTFLGRWKVGDGMGGHFYITLDANGGATKSVGASHGTWNIVGSEARIKWDDGWHDAIRKVGKNYEKFAYSPEKSFADTPSNVTDAQNLEPQAN